MKNFLYERLGKDYVVSRLGNSGLELLIRLEGFTIALGGLQSYGLHQNSILYESIQHLMAAGTAQNLFKRTGTECENGAGASMILVVKPPQADGNCVSSFSGAGRHVQNGIVVVCHADCRRE